MVDTLESSCRRVTAEAEAESFLWHGIFQRKMNPSIPDPFQTLLTASPLLEPSQRSSNQPEEEAEDSSGRNRSGRKRKKNRKRNRSGSAFLPWEARSFHGVHSGSPFRLIVGFPGSWNQPKPSPFSLRLKRRKKTRSKRSKRRVMVIFLDSIRLNSSMMTPGLDFESSH
jgi:hypothetical protein